MSDPASGRPHPRLREFADEVRRQRAVVARELTRQAPDREAIFRSLHAIKGCASIMGFDELATVVHGLEMLEPDELRPRVGELDRCVAQSTGLPAVSAVSGRDAAQANAAVEFLRGFERNVGRFAAERGKRIDFKVELRARKFLTSRTKPIFTALVHAIINAIDHGIESPAERRAAGKPEVGHIELVISPDRIVVRDDGRGVQAEDVVERALQHGVVSPDIAARLTDREALQLLFHPSLTLAPKVSRTSGRGIGLTGVLREAEKIGGTAWIESDPGHGTELHVETGDVRGAA